MALLILSKLEDFFEKKIHYSIIAFIIILEVTPDFCEIKNL